MSKIILASQSKVRKEILDKNGVDNQVEPSNVDEDVVKETMKLINNAGYNIPQTGKNDSDFDTLSKSEMVTSNGDVILEALDESGTLVEDWQLHNAFITSVKFGDFDYSSEDMREIEITFKYDWASCKIGDQAAFFRSEG